MLPRPDFYPLIREGRISAHRTEIARFKLDGVVLKDGTAIAVDCVVLATGWKDDFGYLPADAREALGKDDDGFYLYRYMLHPDLPNLAFNEEIGVDPLRKRGPFAPLKELLAPYQPTDYQTIVAGDWERSDDPPYRQ
jgi:hypothetical protein